jgi:hypothetical protein
MVDSGKRQGQFKCNFMLECCAVLPLVASDLALLGVVMSYLPQVQIPLEATSNQ